MKRKQNTPIATLKLTSSAWEPNGNQRIVANWLRHCAKKVLRGGGVPLHRLYGPAPRKTSVEKRKAR
jgi:hypothetical protein